MAKLAWLWERPSKDGKKHRYYVCYYDEYGKLRQKSLGHADKGKAERQVAKFERKLRMGQVEPDSMKLREFLEDCLDRTRGQIRKTTLNSYKADMLQFIKQTRNIDCHSVTQMHGERFIQACLDKGNRPATVNRKIRSLKRLFQLAVERRQLDENPFRFIKKLKVPKQDIHTYTDDECSEMISAAQTSGIGRPFRWDLFILTALCTGMRRGELLNLTWRDVDFERQNVHVNPKDETEMTWEWHIKDTDRRVLPLPEEVLQMLIDHQAEQPAGYPYVFISPVRYDYIQNRRKSDGWTVENGCDPVANFGRQFQIIKDRAGINRGTFHDLRRTCITNWLKNGLKELEVSAMAGHASFETTRKYYLSIQTDLLDRTRKASTSALAGITLQLHCNGQFGDPIKKAPICKSLQIKAL